MDPRTAARVTAPDVLAAFKDGFVEGRAMALGETETVVRVRFLHDGTAMRERDYENGPEGLITLWDDVLTFLTFGLGTRVEIEIVENDEPAVRTNELEQG